MKKVLLLALLLSIASASFAQYNIGKLMMDGQRLYETEKYGEALEIYNLIVKYKPEIYEGYFMRGVIKYNLHDYRGAILDFSKAIETNPFNPDASFNRGLCKQMIGNVDGALQDFNKTIEIDPSGTRNYLSRGIIYLMLNKPEKALADFNLATRFGLDIEKTLYYRAIAKTQSKDFQGALDDFDKLIKAYPMNVDALSRRGVVKMEMENYDEALLDMNRAIKINDKFSLAYFNRALVYLKQKNKINAMHDFEKVSELEPQNAQAFYNVAILKLELDDKSGSLAALNRVLEINPRNIMALFNRGNVLMELGRHKQAIANYSEAISIYPEFAIAYNNRAIARKKIGDLIGSQADMQLAKKIDKNLMANNGKSNKDMDQLIELKADFRNGLEQSEGMGASNANLIGRFHFIYTGKKSSKKLSLILPYLKDSENASTFSISTALKTIDQDSVRKSIKQTDQEADWIFKQLKQAFLNVCLNDYNNAIESYTEIIGSKPKFGLAYFGRAAAKTEMVDFINSLNNLNKADFQSNNNESMKKVVIQDYSDVIADYNKAIELEPIFPEAYYNRAELFARQSNFSAAIADYNEAIKENPNFIEAHYNLGLTLIIKLNDKNGCLNLSKAGELGMSKVYPLIQKYCND